MELASEWNHALDLYNYLVVKSLNKGTRVLTSIFFYQLNQSFNDIRSLYIYVHFASGQNHFTSIYLLFGVPIMPDLAWNLAKEKQTRLVLI